MKNTLLNLFLASLLAVFPWAASAEDNGASGYSLEHKAAYDAVNSELGKSTAPADIIRMLTKEPYDMSLSEATVFAMVSGGQANRVAFATAGIESASNLAQAQAVANAVKATVDVPGAVATAVDEAMVKYAELMAQPDVYKDVYSPKGAGVSPAA